MTDKKPSTTEQVKSWWKKAPLWERGVVVTAFTLAIGVGSAEVVNSWTAPSPADQAVAAQAKIKKECEAGSTSPICNSGIQVSAHATSLPYKDFIKAANNGGLSGIKLEGQRATGIDSNGHLRQTPVYNPDIFLDKISDGVSVETLMPAEQQMVVVSGDGGGASGGGSMLGGIGGMVLSASIFAAIFIGAQTWMQKRQQGGGGAPGAFGKSKARRVDPGASSVRFSDVAGVDAVKGRLMEMVDLLKNPERPGSLGGKHPTGFLMSGPPGTGKTLLAKAVAGEAGVPFFSASGSEFVEMYVGTGAARIRDLFKEAKALNKPCVIFIDEIDAVGGKRSEGGSNGGGKEHEQTLNQLLTEMDGFDGRESVIVIAATNRPEMLDPALKRSGRFNKEIVVPLPDIRARTEVAQLYFDKLSDVAGRNVIGADVSARDLAVATPGMSPADIAGLINEAALEAERRGHEYITWKDVSEARDTHWMGDADHNKVMTQEEKAATAWHEAGHAMVAILNPQCNPPDKLTVLPRGGALGMLVRLPTADRVSMTYDKLLGDIEVGYAGREAEIMIYGIEGTSTGASQDFKQVTDIATRMVMDWGMPLNSEKDPDLWTGSRYHGREQEALFGRSEESNAKIDAQIQKILEQGQKNARQKVTENRDKLELIVKALLKYETLRGSHIKRIVEGENIDDIMADEKSGSGIEINDIDPHAENAFVVTNDNKTPGKVAAAVVSLQKFDM